MRCSGVCGDAWLMLMMMMTTMTKMTTMTMTKMTTMTTMPLTLHHRPRRPASIQRLLREAHDICGGVQARAGGYGGKGWGGGMVGVCGMHDA